MVVAIPWEIIKMKYYYYKIENLTNNKKYIGITKDPIEREKRHFSQLAHNTHVNSKLQNAYNQFKDKFKFEVLVVKEFDDYKEAYEYEVELIKQHDSFYSGYNLTFGGDLNPMNSPGVKEKMKRTKQSQVENIYQIKKINETNFLVLDKYPSAKEAQRITGFSQANISRACNGLSLSSNGYYWCYEKNIDNWIGFIPIQAQPIALLDNSNNIKNVYMSTKEPAELFNLKRNSITASIYRGGKVSGLKFVKISKEEFVKFKNIIIVNPFKENL